MNTTEGARVDHGAVSPVAGDEWEAALVGEWRAGVRPDRLALRYNVPLAIVEGLVKRQVRLRDLREGLPASHGGAVDVDGDAAHVAAVSAAGGFPVARAPAPRVKRLTGFAAGQTRMVGR